jgi:hypothetical protein
MAAHVDAAAVQLDSHIPGSEQDVVLTSLADDGMGSATGQQQPGAALQLALEVHHCPPFVTDGSNILADRGSSSDMSFRNGWVHELLIQLPTLAIAADDALLLFLERMSSLGYGSSDGRDGSTGSGEPSIAGAAPAVPPVRPSALVAARLASEAAGAAASRLYAEQAVVEPGAKAARHLAVVHLVGAVCFALLRLGLR